MINAMAPILAQHHIEVRRTASGTLLVYCSRCVRDNLWGSAFCCDWAIAMFQAYFRQDHSTHTGDVTHELTAMVDHHLRQTAHIRIWGER